MQFYKGSWQNGVMSGSGLYIWKAYYNNTMALPSIGSYHGLWENGNRNGYGVLNLGLSLGSHYKGNFKDNKKHGPGKFVTNNGLILRNNKMLFIDDILGPVTSVLDDEPPTNTTRSQLQFEPCNFNICDDTVGLMYHVQRAFQNINKEVEIRSNMINDYMENNKIAKKKISLSKEFEIPELQSDDAFRLDSILKFEERSLYKSVRCFETELRNIYYTYASICNTEEINFPPIMIRLYLWQFYNDCNVHEKGLYLIETDKMFHECPDWLSRNPHDPFEKIYFWQFLHSLISVAKRLYAKRQLPSVRPDTILGSAFRTFMEKDALPCCGRHKGYRICSLFTQATIPTRYFHH